MSHTERSSPNLEIHESKKISHKPSNEEEEIIFEESSSSKESLEFGDADCGEPMTAQSVVLDFTPTEDDIDEMQQKCCVFWDFVKSHPELKDMMVNPANTDSYIGVKSNDTLSIARNTMFDIKEKTAVSMLELVEEKDIISRAFEAKLPTSACNQELKDYFNDPIYTDDSPKNKLEFINSKQEKRLKGKRVSSTTTRKMCKAFDEWDLEHPKCLSPPGPVPNLGND